jgi:hypothetical protein
MSKDSNIRTNQGAARPAPNQMVKASESTAKLQAVQKPAPSAVVRPPQSK